MSPFFHTDTSEVCIFGLKCTEVEDLRHIFHLFYTIWDLRYVLNHWTYIFVFDQHWLTLSPQFSCRGDPTLWMGATQSNKISNKVCHILFWDGSGYGLKYRHFGRYGSKTNLGFFVCFKRWTKLPCMVSRVVFFIQVTKK